MGHAVPKIHYQILSTTGDTTSASAVVSDIADTTEIAVGMYVSGTGIPVDTTVLSKTSSTVTLSANATATGGDVALEFYKKIVFDYPPIEPAGEKLAAQERKSKSLSGVTQVSIDHVEGVRNPIFSFLSNTIYLQLKTFYQDSAVFGETFKYFDDKTLTTYNTYELRDFDWAPEIITYRATTPVWRVPLQFRRVVI